MNVMLVFQIIMLGSLAIYMLYILYYVAVPLFRLRMLMLIAYKKYRCTDVRVSDTGVVVRIMKDGQERVLWGRMDPTQDISYYAMMAGTELKKVLRKIRKGDY